MTALCRPMARIVMTLGGMSQLGALRESPADRLTRGLHHITRATPLSPSGTITVRHHICLPWLGLLRGGVHLP